MDGESKGKSGRGEGEETGLGEVWEEGTEKGDSHLGVGERCMERIGDVLMSETRLDGTSVFRTPDNPFGEHPLARMTLTS